MNVRLEEFRKKWDLSAKVIGFFVIPGLIVQYFVRMQGWNILDINIIIASLLTGAIFLIGFMLSGTLTDYKEGEKLLGQTVNCILSLQDHNRSERNIKRKINFLKNLVDINIKLKKWLYNEINLDILLNQINGLSSSISKFSTPDAIARAENQQKELRENIMRINVIKNTTFIKAGYAIMELISAVVCVLIIFSRTDTFLMAAATFSASTFILVYMIMLIQDVDDPFEFGTKEGVAESSLIPLRKTEELLKKELSRLK